MPLGLGRWLLAGFIFAVLLAVLLYQLFAPGSELRYYRCRQGSIKGSEMWFTFTTHDVQVSCFLSISLHTREAFPTTSLTELKLLVA